MRSVTFGDEVHRGPVADEAETSREWPSGPSMIERRLCLARSADASDCMRSIAFLVRLERLGEVRRLHVLRRLGDDWRIPR